MNEQLQQALAAMLNKTVSGVEAGIGFLQSEIPEVIQQLLMWKFTLSLVWFSIGVALLVAVYPMYRSGVAAANKARADYAKSEPWTRFARGHDLTSHAYDWAVTKPLAFTALPALFGVIIVTANLDWLQIWLAPKIYLIEYAASLAK